MHSVPGEIETNSCKHSEGAVFRYFGKVTICEDTKLNGWSYTALQKQSIQCKIHSCNKDSLCKEPIKR